MAQLIPTLALIATATLLAACESNNDNPNAEGTPVSEQEEQLREKAGLHPADKIEPDPRNAEELKEEIDLHSEGNKPQSPQEMREMMDLHPNDRRDAGR